MSTSYYASAIIGVAIDLRTLRDKMGRRVPSCEHPQREGNRFCPVCGKPVEDKVEFWASSSMDDLVQSLPDGYACSRVGDNNMKSAIGFGVVTRYDSDFVSAALPAIDEVRERLKAALEPLGLWDETTFGLHAVASVS